jgi:hypothetical protein
MMALRLFLLVVCVGFISAQDNKFQIVKINDESDRAPGTCYSYSNNEYKCTDWVNWDAGKGSFDDNVPSGQGLSRVVVVVNGDSSCSATSNFRNYTFSMNTQTLGSWTNNNIPYDCGYTTCDASSLAPNADFTITDDSFYNYGASNDLYMVDSTGQGDGCFGSYNLTLYYGNPTPPPPPPGDSITCCGYSQTNTNMTQHVCVPPGTLCPTLSDYKLATRNTVDSCDTCGPLCCLYQNTASPSETMGMCATAPCGNQAGFSNIAAFNVKSCDYCFLNR